MVLGFVKQSKGYNSVRLERGVGTTFSIYPPRAGKKVEHQVAPTPSVPPSAARNEFILVIEGEDDVRATIDRG